MTFSLGPYLVALVFLGKLAVFILGILFLDLAALALKKLQGRLTKPVPLHPVLDGIAFFCVALLLVLGAFALFYLAIVI